MQVFQKPNCNRCQLMSRAGMMPRGGLEALSNSQLAEEKGHDEAARRAGGTRCQLRAEVDEAARR